MARTFRRIYSFVKEVLAEFAEDNGSLIAAAMSFFGLLSLIPLFLLAVILFGYVLRSSDRAFAAVLQFTSQYVPIRSSELELVLRSIQEQSGVLGGIALLGLLWTGSQFFAILQQAMNVALGVRKRISYVRNRLVGLSMVAVAGFLFFLSFALSWALTVVRHYSQSLLGIPTDRFSWLWQGAALMLPVVLSFGMFWIIYRFLPLTRIKALGPVLGGVVAALLFEIAKYGFRWYVANLASFSRIYGSLGVVMVLILWVYYVSMITLLGAEVASVYDRHGRERAGAS